MVTAFCSELYIYHSKIHLLLLRIWLGLGLGLSLLGSGTETDVKDRFLEILQGSCLFRLVYGPQ